MAKTSTSSEMWLLDCTHEEFLELQETQRKTVTEKVYVHPSHPVFGATPGAKVLHCAFLIAYLWQLQAESSHPILWSLKSLKKKHVLSLFNIFSGIFSQYNKFGKYKNFKHWKKQQTYPSLLSFTQLIYLDSIILSFALLGWVLYWLNCVS